MSVTRGQHDARSTVTFPAARHHCPLAGTKLYCLVTKVHVLTTCPELQSTAQRLGFEPTTYWSHLTATPPSHTSQTEIVIPTASTEHVPPCRVSRETRWSGWSFRVPSRRRVSCRCDETTSSAASWRLPAGSRAVFRRTPWCSSAARQTSSSTITHKHCVPVMWSETIGLRTKRTKKIGLGFGLARCGLGLGGLVLCCETWSCYDCRHNDLEGHSNFSSTIFLFFLLCAWNITTYCM